MKRKTSKATGDGYMLNMRLPWALVERGDTLIELIASDPDTLDRVTRSAVLRMAIH